MGFGREPTVCMCKQPCWGQLAKRRNGIHGSRTTRFRRAGCRPLGVCSPHSPSPMRKSLFYQRLGASSMRGGVVSRKPLKFMGLRIDHRPLKLRSRVVVRSGIPRKPRAIPVIRASSTSSLVRRSTSSNPQLEQARRRPNVRLAAVHIRGRPSGRRASRRALSLVSGPSNRTAHSTRTPSSSVKWR